LEAVCTVDDERNGLDIKVRTFERRAFAGELPCEEERVAVYTREDTDFQMHDLDIVKAERLGLVADLVDDAENDR